MVELRDAGAARKVGGDGQVWPAWQYVADKRRKVPPRPRLDEDAHAGIVHGLDRLAEPHPPRPLRNGQFTDRLWVVRIARGRGAGIEGDPGRRDIERPQENA